MGRTCDFLLYGDKNFKTTCALQFLFSLIDLLYDRRGSEKLKCAAHRKTFLRLVIEAFTAAGIQRGYTDPAA